MERRYGARARCVFPYLGLAAALMALFLAVQVLQAFSGADPRALQQELGGGVAAGSLSIPFVLFGDSLSPWPLIFAAAIAALDQAFHAVLPSARTVARGGRHLCVAGSVMALVLAQGLGMALMAWCLIGLLMVVDAADGIEGSERAIPSALLAWEAAGLLALFGTAVMLEEAVGSLSWEVIARADFSVLRAKGVVGVELLGLVVGLVSFTCFQRVTALGWRSGGAGALAPSFLILVSTAYLANRCGWAWALSSRMRSSSIAVMLAVGLSCVGWAVVRDRWFDGRGGIVHTRNRNLAPVTEGVAALLVGLDRVFHDKIPALLVAHVAGIRASLSTTRSRWGPSRYRGRAAPLVLGVVAGTAVVLGSLYLRPSISSLRPNEVHSFGGIRPRMHRPGKGKVPRTISQKGRRDGQERGPGSTTTEETTP